MIRSKAAGNAPSPAATASLKFGKLIALRLAPRHS